MVPIPKLPVLLDTRINSVSLDWIVRAPLLPEGFPTKLHFIAPVEDKSNLVVLPEVPEILNVGEFPETSKFVTGFVVPIPKLEVEALNIKPGFVFNDDVGFWSGVWEKTIFVVVDEVSVVRTTFVADAAVPIPVSLDPSP